MPSKYLTNLTDRQAREIQYHRARASENMSRSHRLVTMNVVESAVRRPWNAYWSLYDLLITWNVHNRNILVPGCGFGEDAIRLALMGANVYAFDISEDSIAIAKKRAALHGINIKFDIMASEKLIYSDNNFDAVLFVNVLHHVDIRQTMVEINRVLRPGAFVFGDELYTHSWAQCIRESRMISKWVYPLMRKYIYGTNRPYITDDERKIDEHDLYVVLQHLSNYDLKWFDIVIGRLVPARRVRIAKLDRALMRAIGDYGRAFAGRVLFSGPLHKSSPGNEASAHCEV